MAYRAPGINANFIPTKTNVVTSGQQRIMALIGTGLTYFERNNVAITRNNSSILDELPDKNVSEIYSITSNKVTSQIDPNNINYTNYTLYNNSIKWKPLDGTEYQAY